MCELSFALNNYFNQIIIITEVQQPRLDYYFKLLGVEKARVHIFSVSGGGDIF